MKKLKKVIYYILYNSRDLKRYNKTAILYYSDNFEDVLDKQENQFTKSSLYIYESNILGPKQRIGRIKCHDHNCSNYVIIIDQEIPPTFPFCSKLHQWLDLIKLLEAGKEEVDIEEYDNIE